MAEHSLVEVCGPEELLLERGGPDRQTEEGAAESRQPLQHFAPVT